MTFNRVNNMVGWLVCLVACTVYVLTMEPTGSLWDCGEFVACADKVQIPHPPGAPLFILLGRFFIILFGDNPETAARAVNFMNAIASGFTILFLFWTITHFARKLVQTGSEALSGRKLFITMAAGVVGALAYTFSDSFWYSAVEGEVYALSSLFTAVVFWAILKWEHEVDLESKTDGHKFSRADRWLIFIFYMMGLSIGVHLLNLLTIPAIVMVYYFKRYKVSRWGMFAAFVIGCIITGLVQVAIIQWSIRGAGAFDIFFVNNLGLPFFSGFAFYFVLLGFLLVMGLRFSEKQIQKFKAFPVWLSAIILLFSFPFINSFGTFILLALGIGALVAICNYYKQGITSFLKIGIWCAIFVILGYSTYFTTLIRSSANPSVDMYNVDNPVSLVGYLGREQYGDWPILYGPFFTDRPTQENFKIKGPRYVKGKDENGKDKYLVAGQMGGIDFSSMRTAHLFPRAWDPGNDRGQETVYRSFGRLAPDEEPTRATDVRYFVSYQFNWMYLRYFLWNFAGKQNDLQGFGNPRDGNWNSGINWIDKKIFGHGTPDVLPETAGSKNKANNKLYFLPLILGILGFIYQLTRNRRDWLVAFLLFFFTGFAIVIYLNQAGFQPRERDYAYVGSFYAFAIWIGLGVIFVRDKLANLIKGSAIADYAAFGVCLLAVPVLMASQVWDDHDRSQKTLARDLGNNYLESCDKNAILISFGDNDTYPLWYAVEVERKRPDLRVVNYSLLGTDWYINQLRYKLNDSPPTDIIFTPEQIQGSKRDRVWYYRLPGYSDNEYYDLYTILKDVVGSDAPDKTGPSDGEERPNVYPVKKFKIPVDTALVAKTIPLNPGEQFVPELRIDVNLNSLDKNELAVLAIIAGNKWQRPIYFTSTQELERLGLAKYVRMEGLTYRLVPIENSDVAVDIAFKNVMEKFSYGGANKPGTYFDEENRRHINSIRQTHAFLAMSLVEQGKKDSAIRVLRKYDQNVLEENVPYGMTSNRGNFHNRISATFLYAAYRAGDLELAKKVHQSIKRDLEQQLRYYQSLGDEMLSYEAMAAEASALMRNKGGMMLSEKQQNFANDILSSYQMLLQLDDLEKQFAPPAPTTQPAENAAPVLQSGDSSNQ